MRVYLSSTSPGLDQDALRIQLRVQLDEAVPDGIDGALAVQEIPVQTRQITQIALAQDAAGARLICRGGRTGWRRNVDIDVVVSICTHPPESHSYG
jgi:hypothetical protein